MLIKDQVKCLSEAMLEELAEAYLRHIGAKYFRPRSAVRLDGDTIIGKKNRPEGFYNHIPKDTHFRCIAEVTAHLLKLPFDEALLWEEGTCYKCRAETAVYYEDGFDQEGLCRQCLGKE